MCRALWKLPLNTLPFGKSFKTRDRIRAREQLPAAAKKKLVASTPMRRYRTIVGYDLMLPDLTEIKMVSYHI